MKAIYQKPDVEIMKLISQECILAGSINLNDDEVDPSDADSRGGSGFFDDDE